MTDLEAAILDILRLCRKSQPARALMLEEIHAHLVGRGWDVRVILPHNIMSALIALADAGYVSNELAWRALADVPTQDTKLEKFE